MINNFSPALVICISIICFFVLSCKILNLLRDYYEDIRSDHCDSKENYRYWYPITIIAIVVISAIVCCFVPRYYKICDIEQEEHKCSCVLEKDTLVVADTIVCIIKNSLNR